MSELDVLEVYRTLKLDLQFFCNRRMPIPPLPAGIAFSTHTSRRAWGLLLMQGARMGQFSSAYCPRKRGSRGGDGGVESVLTDIKGVLAFCAKTCSEPTTVGNHDKALSSSVMLCPELPSQCGLSIRSGKSGVYR